jgi:late competence protein required for DNA uptake (superfamily II DNA/RNA helicase)
MSAMSRTKHDVENEIVYCTRCGQSQSFEQVYKRKIRNAVNAEWCRDCRDDRTEIRRDYAWKHPALGKVHCWLWTGELNDNWQPITEDGELYRPGKRLCGLKDCVKQAHIIETE